MEIEEMDTQTYNNFICTLAFFRALHYNKNNKTTCYALCERCGRRCPVV